MEKIVIEGGHRLEGTVVVSGAKNAALPILVSALLSDGTNTFDNVPDLKDVRTIKTLLADLGAKVETSGSVVKVDATGLNNQEAPYDLVRTMRASVLVLGPLLARLGRARVSLPGGCAIGARPINLHLKGLEELGAVISLSEGYIEAEASSLKGAEIYFDIVTVTGTENLMMAAVFAEGLTTLRNAAREPEIVALAEVLNQMGAQITGAGTPVIEIRGVKTLKPTSFSIIPDRIETGTFMIAAGVTGGDIKIVGCDPNHFRAVINKLRQTGMTVEQEADGLRVVGAETISSADVKTLPYPGFPTDMQAQFMVLMCFAEGLSVISETIFENRFIHVSELQRMGADITVSGSAAVVKGGQRLTGAPVMATDLRASASLILAGLAAEGTTEVARIYHIDRGYESIEKKLSQLGGKLERVNA
ncbi:MAG: UDP-N-acetylglucosamine 1-carboxyvinyltransferase [Deltaproteobacteria bacterium]|nr:UDP-N-acetylglucosamine 1-carboxyvinyltransferase [Deltaproteobacteria bacterium]MBW2172515.1 UDP-N-acetylglucosamine 1-carboxyvinyltransferase [Deltaproteobacteria bacterium]MBW2259922.1 UDP-N-acetylglucosamine 1-carboxyvinyltransferase [Deltaproteobacteria bacterium]